MALSLPQLPLLQNSMFVRFRASFFCCLFSNAWRGQYWVQHHNSRDYLAPDIVNSPPKMHQTDKEILKDE